MAKKKLTERGIFIKTTDEYLKNCSDVLQVLDTFKKHEGGHINLLLEQIKNSIVGHYLGFDETNVEKHGYDGKMTTESGQQIYVEEKQLSLIQKHEPKATFNDWTLEKNKDYEKNNVWVAAALWENYSRPLCIVFGKTNEGLSDYLEKETIKRYNSLKKDPNKVLRVSPTVEVTYLVKNCHCKVLSIHDDPETLVEKLAKQHIKITVNDVVTRNEFNTQRDIVEKSDSALF